MNVDKIFSNTASKYTFILVYSSDMPII